MALGLQNVQLKSTVPQYGFFVKAHTVHGAQHVWHYEHVSWMYTKQNAENVIKQLIEGSTDFYKNLEDTSKF